MYFALCSLPYIAKISTTLLDQVFDDFTLHRKRRVKIAMREVALCLLDRIYINKTITKLVYTDPLSKTRSFFKHYRFKRTHAQKRYFTNTLRYMFSYCIMLYFIDVCIINYIFFKQSYETSSKGSVKMEYICNVSHITNTTHLVDHDYAVTRYFDIYNETTDDDMQEGL